MDFGNSKKAKAQPNDFERGYLQEVRSKYRNHKIKIGGLTFDSKLESEHYLLLKNRLNRGEIRDLARQVSIPLTSKPKGKDRAYIADFVYFDVLRDSWTIWDSKGLKIEPYPTKRDWLLDKYNGFVFVEASKDGEKEFVPWGSIPLKFK